MRRRRVAGILLGLFTIVGAAGAQVPCGSWSHSPTSAVDLATGRLLGVAALSASDVWAVGSYDSLAGTYTPLYRALAAHWNGSAWSRVSTPSVGPSGTTLTDVAGNGPSDVWAVGYSSTYGTPQTLVQRWNGSQWSVVPSPVITGGSSLASLSFLGANAGWAVGNRAGGLPDFAGTVVTLTVRWDGSSWTPVPSPNVANRWNDLADVAALSANDAWAVGSSRDIGGLYQNLAMHWNGSAWMLVPVPNVANAENELQSVAGVASDDVWAVGGANDGVTSQPVFLHWNGSAWSRVAGPGGGGSVNGSVALVAIASDDVWAIGGTLAHWDGSSWILAPNPPVSGALGIALAGGSKAAACDVWAVGASFDLDSQRPLAVHLTPGGGAINAPPVAVASGTPLHGLAPLTVNLASSSSYDTDGQIASRHWDFGDSTYPPEQSAADPVHTYVQTGPLTYHAVVQVVDDRGAVAAASVEIHVDVPIHVESQAVTRSAQGGEWVGEDVVVIRDVHGQPVAGATVSAAYSGPTGGSTDAITDGAGAAVLRTASAGTPSSDWCFSVTGVARDGAGYVPANNVVTNQCESPATSGAVPRHPAGSLALAAGPNPFARDVTLRLDLPSPASVSVRVLDAAGRLVRELAREAMPAGAHVLRWDGLDAGGMPAPAGLYIVRVAAGEQSRSVRLLRLR